MAYTSDGHPTSLQFFMDGKSGSVFQYTPDNTTDYLYNHLVYQQIVENGTHTLKMTVPPSVNRATILFDYAVYTYVSVKNAQYHSLTASDPVNLQLYQR
jgi:hypothetical protein